MRIRLLLFLVFVSVFSLASCGDPSPGQPDLATPDLATPDLVEARPDLAIPDVSMPDLAIPDVSMPDLAMPDLSMPDLAMPDLSLPDLSMPDLSMPDLSMPDLSKPDLSMPDLVAPPDLARFLGGPFSCKDGKLNGGETAVDCGGACGPCDDGKTCVVKSDCKSNVCTNGVCAASYCNNGVRDKDETDIDCGGFNNVCARCPAGRKCNSDTDCLNYACVNNVCPLDPIQLAVPLRVSTQGVGNVILADLDKDGAIDLAQASWAPRGYQTQPGRGDGTIGPAVTVAIQNTQPFGITGGDLDSDGDFDLVVGDDFGPLYVMLNAGNGVFGNPVTDRGSIRKPYGLKAFDVTADNKLDLVSTSDNYAYTRIGDGKGGFGAEIGSMGNANERGQALWVGPLKQGQSPALVTTGPFATDTFTVWSNSGNGKWTPSRAVMADNDPSWLDGGDFDKDGDIDLVVAHNAGNTTAIFLNTQNGWMKSQSFLGFGAAPVVADFDGDGSLDVAECVSTMYGGAVRFLRGAGNGTFVALSSRWLGCGTPLTAGDLDGDNRVDLVGPGTTVQLNRSP